MNNFKTPVSIFVENEKDAEELTKQLIDLGYKDTGYKYSKNHPWLLTRFGGTIYNLGFNGTDGDYGGRTIFTSKDKEPFLALAAMKEGEEFFRGEAVVAIKDSGHVSRENRYSKDKLYFVKSTEQSIINTTYDDRKSTTNAWHGKFFRKATKEEIITHFTKDEFVLPESWMIMDSEEVTEAINEQFDRRFTKARTEGYYWYRDGVLRHSSNSEATPLPPKITLEQFNKHFNKRTMERKIIGYKAPKDLFGGTIKTGTVYKPLSSSPSDYMFAAVNEKDCPIDGGRTNLPREVVEAWEPIYENKLKYYVGDYLFCIKDFRMTSGAIAYKAGSTYKSEYRNCITDEQGDKSHGMFFEGVNEWFRLATQEEIEEFNKVSFGRYKLEKIYGGGKIGCVVFSKGEANFIKTLVEHPEAKTELKIFGVTIDSALINKIISQI